MVYRVEGLGFAGFVSVSWSSRHTIEPIPLEQKLLRRIKQVKTSQRVPRKVLVKRLSRSQESINNKPCPTGRQWSEVV